MTARASPALPYLNARLKAVSAKVTSKVNYRNGAGILMKKAGTLEKGTAVKVYLAAKPVTAAQGSSSLWYRIKVGSKYYYACSSAIKITGSSSKKETTSSKSTTKASFHFSLKVLWYFMEWQKSFSPTTKLK